MASEASADPVKIDGVVSSAALRADLTGQTILLAFSRGKDSIAAAVALREAGVDVIPFHRINIPGLAFVDRDLEFWDDWFGRRVIRVPNVRLWRQLANCVYQPPQRQEVIDAADLVVPTFRDLNDAILDDLGLSRDTWIADGVRAADNPHRRRAMVQHGPVNQAERHIRVVWDWRLSHVHDAVQRGGARLPVDYQWFGRSFDGLDWRFMAPLAEHAPDDFARIVEWFPLVELELMRYQLSRGFAKQGAS